MQSSQITQGDGDNSNTKTVEPEPSSVPLQDDSESPNVSVRNPRPSSAPTSAEMSARIAEPSVETESIVPSDAGTEVIPQVTINSHSSKRKEGKKSHKTKKKIRKHDGKIEKNKSKSCHGCREMVDILRDTQKNIVSLTASIAELKKDNAEMKTALKFIEDNWRQVQSAREANDSTVEGPDTTPNVDCPNQLPQPGFVRQDGKIEVIHCGENVWIPKKSYDDARKNAKTNAIFVKNLALIVFGHDELKGSSVTGVGCPRTKSQAKPALDSTKCLAVRSIFEYYLRKSKKYSEAEISAELAEYLNHIRGKISDMNRPPKSQKSRNQKNTANVSEKNQALSQANQEKASGSVNAVESGEESEEEGNETSEVDESGDQTTVNDSTESE